MPQAKLRHDAKGDRSIEAWGGVLTGTVSEWADALGCDPATVVDTIEAAGIQLLVDTSRQKRQKRNRPTDPELRSVAMVPEEASALRDAVRDGEGPHEAEQIPPEREARAA
jgi:hypothetical protein